MTDQPSIAAALAAVMEEVRAVRKDGRNTQQNYAFRGIDAVVNAVGPALRKHRVIVVPMLESVNYRDVQTSTGKASRECTVTVRYRFHGPAGDHLDCVTPGESMDFGDKGAPKAMSVAYRIALLQALCLPTDDADPDSTSYERGHSTARQAPTQRNGQEKPAPSAIDAAKEKLRYSCKENGWDLSIVADLFAGEQGAELKDVTDPAVVEKFRASLFAIPSEQLTKATS